MEKEKSLLFHITILYLGLQLQYLLGLEKIRD